MKTPIAVTFVIMGALVVMTPALSDFFFQRNLVALLSRPGITNVNLDGKMGDLYRIGCWSTGTAMIGIVILISLFSRNYTSQHPPVVARGLIISPPAPPATSEATG
jgi:hypothetical protein